LLWFLEGEGGLDKWALVLDNALGVENQVMEKERRDWKKEDLDRLMDLLSKGYTYKEIAAVLGRSYDSIRGIVKRIRRNDSFSDPNLPLEARGGGKRNRGLLDMTTEEVRGLLKGGGKGSDNTNTEEKKEHAPGSAEERKEPRTLKRVNSSSWVLSDYEASKVIERYLKRTRNIEGAKNLWKLHLQYKKRYYG